MSINLLGDFILWAIAFIFSTTLHEASHAIVGKMGGDLTAASVGQASLNPLPHIKREPMGMILFPILTFFLYHGSYMLGWASAPYDPQWALRHPRRSALMALAGPASNALLVIISFLVLKFGLGYTQFQIENPTGVFMDTIAQLFYILLRLNLILALFNLIPFPPLDGSEIVLLLFPESRANDIRLKIRSIGFFGLILAWMIFPSVYYPVWDFVSRFLN